MIRKQHMFVILGFALGGAVLNPEFGRVKSVHAQEKQEVYSAVMIPTRAGLGARSVDLTMRVREYTSDEELQELAEILAEGGQDALQRRMEKLRLGTIAPTGRLGSDIAVARRRSTENGTRIVLVTARSMSFLELRSGGRSTDYPFSIVRFDLDDEGRGEGQVIAAARVRFDKEGRLEVESLGRGDIRLSRVRRRN